ncbi:MAG: hypothetical protein R3E82_21680 [Pseudomonadales bacterium]|nr:hypothetical protein [Pseudomonadales bacterium]
MGVLAGFALLVGGADALQSQWSSVLIGTTHFLTLGVVTTTMLGALFQLMPVLGGVGFPATRKIATAVHLCLGSGTLLLAAGFVVQLPVLFNFALPLLLTAFCVFLSGIGYLLLHRLGSGTSMFCIRLASIALLVTIVIGLIRAASYIPGVSVPDWSVLTVSVHFAWGLAGWVLILIMGVSYQVIPMFHVTPGYPVILARSVPSALLIALVVLTSVPGPVGRSLAGGLICTAMVVYAVCTLGLLNKRKRKLIDVTVNFWRLTMIGLLTVAGLFIGARLWDDPTSLIGQRLNMGIGIVAIYGVACSVIMGMMQKIIPFLLYLHLQRQAMSAPGLLSELPHGKLIVPDWCSMGQWWLHLAALVLLLAASWFEVLAAPAALMVICDFAFLGYWIAAATRLYIRTQGRVRSALGM